jgi:tetratricopeptide (TPR) repeat protein
MARPLKQTRRGGAPSRDDIGQALSRLHEGRFEDARALCEQLLERRPADRDALHLLGLAQLKLGRDTAAVEALERAAAGPSTRANAQLLNNLATAYRRCGRSADAVAAADRALAADPRLARAHINAALALEAAGDTEGAIERHRSACAADPRFAAARRGLADLLSRLGRRAESAEEYAAALLIEPGHAPTWNARGAALAADGRLDEASKAFARAIALDPSLADAHSNLGNARAVSGRAAEAISDFERAIALAPGIADYHCNLGHALRQIDRDDDALACYGRALALDAKSIEASFGAAVIHLSHGRYAQGWRHYLRRDSMKSAPADLERERLPVNLDGKRILVLADQGLGDEIFFLRFAPLLRARGARIAYRPEPRLREMLRRAPIAERVLGPDEPWDSDVRLSVSDLPYLLAMADHDAPPPSIALAALPDRESRMASRLTALGPPPHIGIGWRAGTRGVARRLDKEVPHVELGRALAPIRATYVALQRSPAPGEIPSLAQTLGQEVHDLSDVNDDLESMLALVGLLDEYVTVSNTNVHLRAARGRDCRVLVPYPPEFRWMATGAESPWFPETRLYRQASDGGWSRALAALTADLAREHPAASIRALVSAAP